MGRGAVGVERGGKRLQAARWLLRGPIALARRVCEQLNFTPDGVVVHEPDNAPRDAGRGRAGHEGPREYTVGTHGVMRVNNGSRRRSSRRTPST